MAPIDVKALSFFLNEQHELSRDEKPGGGSLPKYAPIDWTKKGNRIHSTLLDARKKVQSLPDPTRGQHYFLLARPETSLKKESVNKRKAPSGEFDEPTIYAGKDSRVFTRLGMDLLRVGEDGTAVVHITPERADQFESSTSALADSGVREQVRWATVESFDLVPLAMKIDLPWLEKISRDESVESVIELHPLLSRFEIDEVFRAIVSAVQVNAPRGQTIRGTGADFSGRQWLRASLSAQALRAIATSFSSVQSLHSPLISTVAMGSSPTMNPSNIAALPQLPQDLNSLPTVAVVDTGIPTNHPVLAPLRRGGYNTVQNTGGVGSHGSMVASRIVFGDSTNPSALSSTPTPQVRFFDVNVALGPNQIDDKELLQALEAVVRTTPDVRVFNLSFDNDPLQLMQPVKRYESLVLAQDLDNFIFQYDVLVVVAAGNSPKGITPQIAYPNHYEDPSWRLGAFASSFNSLTCGSYVSQLSASGAVKQLGWPSPFCRVGPGIGDSTKPDFSAAGGNQTDAYTLAAGLGVWGIDSSGFWRESCGTSLSAPLLSREAAFAFRKLDSVCASDAKPYAALVKAFLALTAKGPTTPPGIAQLCKRTLGYGTASSERLTTPLGESAVLLWQGVLEDKSDVARVQIPIPKAWLEGASKPCLKIFLCGDVPVNAAASDVWSSRKLSMKLLPHAEANALRAKNLTANEYYPLLSRNYSLQGRSDQIAGDLWMVEISYGDAADYLPSMSFASQQRVAFAAELYDADDPSNSPQSALQAMPFTRTMTRLSAPPSVSRMPVMLRY